MRWMVVFCAVAAIAASPELKRYDLDWHAHPDLLVDLSNLNDKPAGRTGFINVRNGHLADGAGHRFRIWGVNTVFGSNAPQKDQAAAAAAYLARFGVNCVRVHLFDARSPRGLIDSKFPDSRHLDPEVLDRFDFYIAELKKQGIYANINLNVGRAFQAGDGVPEADQLGFAKSVTFFDPRIIELEKEYAHALLTHRNPYTGNEYRNEPAVAMLELLNENSLVEAWKQGRLQGKGSPKGENTWTDIPPSYAAELTQLYNQTLQHRRTREQLKQLHGEAGADIVPRLTPADFKTASPLRFSTEAAFYMDLENRFFQTMYTYLKHDLGIRVPIVGTSLHNAGLSPYPLLTSTAQLDVVDGHTYWQHPRFLSDPATGRHTGFEINNTPAVNDPAHSPIANLSRAAVAGKPFIVSEVNHPYPNEYAAEGIPTLAAYAAFQDWDGLFWYCFSHESAETWDTPMLPDHFNIRQDPVKMTQWASAALLFRHAAIEPARQTLERSYTRETILDSLKLPNTEQPFFSPGFSPLLALEHAVRVKSLNASTPAATWPAPHDDHTSDTGQLHWQQGLVTVDSDRWQALIGKASARVTSNLAASIQNDFSAITLAALDDKPIAISARLLLTTGGRVANVGLEWNDKRTRATSMGKPGMQIEPITGAITLRALDKATRVQVTPLDGSSRAAGPAIQATRTSEGWQFPIGDPATPWYLIRVER